ncbi:transcriptional regulator swi6, partial [Kappamyces sp. JEL0680]
MGIDPQNVFQPPSFGAGNPYYAIAPSSLPFPSQDMPFTKASQSGATEKTKKPHDVMTDSKVYAAVYSGVSVFEMMCRSVAVMRRQKDSFLNATQILKVANIDKGKRTKILEKEIMNKEHEKVQGGYGKYQGTWFVFDLRANPGRIPFERGVDLARQFNVDHLLAPLFDHEGSAQSKSDRTPTKDQVHGRPSGRRPSISGTAQAGSASYGNIPPEAKRMKMDSSQTFVESPEVRTDPLYLSEVPFGEHLFDSKLYSHHVAPHYGGYYMDPYHHGLHHIPPPPQPQIAMAAEPPGADRHRPAIMALFLNTGPSSLELLAPHTNLPSDFDINLILDDQGHTALHWAA